MHDLAHMKSDKTADSSGSSDVKHDCCQDARIRSGTPSTFGLGMDIFKAIVGILCRKVSKTSFVVELALWAPNE